MPVALDPATGDVWFFTAWPAPGRQVRALLLTRVPGGVALLAAPSPRGCKRLRIDRRDGPSVFVDPVAP